MSNDQLARNKKRRRQRDLKTPGGAELDYALLEAMQRPDFVRRLQQLIGATLRVKARAKGETSASSQGQPTIGADRYPGESLIKADIDRLAGDIRPEVVERLIGKFEEEARIGEELAEGLVAWLKKKSKARGRKSSDLEDELLEAMGNPESAERFWSFLRSNMEEAMTAKAKRRQQGKKPAKKVGAAAKPHPRPKRKE